MAKIVIDARESGSTSGRYVDNLVKYLHFIKPKHEMIVLTKPNRVEWMKQTAPDFEIIETKHKEFTFDEQLGFLTMIKALEADLVHFPMPQQPVFYRGKVVTTIQDLTTVRFKNPAKNPVVFWFKQQVYKWLIRRVCKKSQQLIAISEFVKGDAAEFAKVPESKFTVTLEAADLLAEKSEPVDGLVGQPYIMYIGRPTPHKNLERLIQAFAELQKSHPDLKLVLAGKKDANYERHEKTVVELGLKNVVFTGFISDEQLRWLYENCRAYVFPSLSEGFGLPGLEAMMHGAPVVSSNLTSLPEVHGDAAEYFDPLSVDDMRRAIESVISDESKRSKMKNAGKKQVAKFSWKRMAEQTLAVYEKSLR